ncbi:catecholate siderophore receptor [Afipia sp. GAS231]|nr:catecholate siderophore receptor [Afipia sp. GAS231]
MLSVSCTALGLLSDIAPVRAQSSDNQKQLPAIEVLSPQQAKRRTAGVPTAQRASRGAQRRAQAARAPEPQAAPKTFGVSQDARTGTVGVYANSTSSATKTNTPLVNIPQSVAVVTKDFIRDQSFQSVTDVTRYVPGVAIHQGEGNRDELVIRGVDSSANFFVNGFRDDVQYFRDLYNTQSLEILKGPSALIFGRGAGGGLVNRTLKEADGTRVYEATMQTGSYGDRRVSLDAGQAVNENVAVRLNAFYEGSDTFRDYGHLERYGINPTVTLKPSDDTKVKLSYEFFHDFRLEDRGNPSQGIVGGATRFNPTTPFAPNGDLTKFFGSPLYNSAKVEVQTGMAVIEHDFGNGLTVRNGSIYSDYNRGYRNVYPGGTGAPASAGGGAVTPDQTQLALNAYQNYTPRENAFNQTDFTYKTVTGPIRHTVAFGTEFGRQTGLSQRDSGFFPDNGNKSFVIVNPFDAAYLGPVNFNHISTDANSKYRLNIASGYVQDQIELTRWLQFLVGARYDSFDMTALDLNANIQRNRVDEKISPRAAVIVKPIDSLSLYTAWSTSYLPASGDQFSTLSTGTLILQPQKFDNTEIGAKWNINPKLLFTAAAYELIRTNVPIANPNGDGTFFPSGAHKIRGFETALTGYVTPEWQSSFGYAYTDARVTSDTSTTIVAGNRVQLVPYNQFSLWNKYQFNPTWAASLGVIYFSDSFASSDDTVRLPGFVRVDAAVYAKIDEMWRVQLNVENLFNKGYWATADSNNNISPGQPRTFRLTAIAKF